MTNSNDVMEKIVSLAKRRGFIYQGSEIYGGLAGAWDYGHYGTALKNNIKALWWKKFVIEREDMFGLDSSIVMNPKVWEASGHVAGFTDPVAECGQCHKRFRADQLNNLKKCPNCDGGLSEVRQFNMMFKTGIGADNEVVYLRPETAQGMFVNFKNYLDSLHPKLPFGIAQIGRAFRNEISPRDFTFRAREFEQMEIEYFIKPSDWKKVFENWRLAAHEWIKLVGLDDSRIHELEMAPENRAHYSKRTIDFEYDFPFGQKELYGLAYRTDFDLSSHTANSKVDLSFLDEMTGERFMPHCVEPTFGLDRTVLALLCDAYREDEMGGEPRVFLKLKPSLAPVQAAVFPLLKNKPDLVEKAREVFGFLKGQLRAVEFDDNGNIGKRYRRQDEIGTPQCVTVDFQTLNDGTVTVRDRDSGTQGRVKIEDLTDFISQKDS